LVLSWDNTLQGTNMKTTNYLSLSLLTLTLLLTACSDKEKTKSLTESGMKCGSGKCGSSMANGSALLLKKKMNILDQLKEEDKRRECVLKAKTSKILYNCVRDLESGRLSIKDRSETFKVTENNIREKKVPKKESNTSMKCESGKCSTGKK